MIVSKPSEGTSYSEDKPDVVDFYFQFDDCENKVRTYLVIDSDFLAKEEISSEELTVIIAQKLLVYEGFRTIFTNYGYQNYFREGYSYEDFLNSLSSQELIDTRIGLERMHWFAVANLGLGPLAQNGKLESHRLKAILPEMILSSKELLSVKPDQWEQWSQNLPENILPGLSSR